MSRLSSNKGASSKSDSSARGGGTTGLKRESGSRRGPIDLKDTTSIMTTGSGLEGGAVGTPVQLASVQEGADQMSQMLAEEPAGLIQVRHFVCMFIVESLEQTLSRPIIMV